MADGRGSERPRDPASLYQIKGREADRVRISLWIAYVFPIAGRIVCGAVFVPRSASAGGGDYRQFQAGVFGDSDKSPQASILRLTAGENGGNIKVSCGSV